MKVIYWDAFKKKREGISLKISEGKESFRKWKEKENGSMSQETAEYEMGDNKTGLSSSRNVGHCHS